MVTLLMLLSSFGLPGSCICVTEANGFNSYRCARPRSYESSNKRRCCQMRINLHSDLVEDVLGLTNQYGYTPGEIISIGIALATVLLREKRLGNQVVVVDAEGHRVGEFHEVEPKAIHEMAREYIQSICPEMGEAPANLLVARLEHERDMEERPAE
jgi:hypothetical protein